MSDNQVISFTKPTIAAITVVLLVLAALAFWYDRGESNAYASSELSGSVQSNTYRNDLQDNRITAVENETKANKKEIHKEQVLRAQMLGTVNSTAKDVREIRRTQESLTLFLMQFDYDKGKKEGSKKEKSSGSKTKEESNQKKKAKSYTKRQ